MNRKEQLIAFLNENPADSFVKHALALEWVKEGNDGQARQIFEDLLSENPGYTGSYYHLAKLYERNGQTDEAVQTYEKGMQVAKQTGERHAYNELQSALEDLLY
jgi:Tfp pilus assembly protein PilF